MTEQAVSAAGTTDAARAWHGMTEAEALAAQGVDAATGLSDAEVESRRAKFGPNKFAEAAKEPRWQAFLRQYRDPMQIVLLGRGRRQPVPARPVRDRRRARSRLTLLNAFLGLSQEGKAEASVAALQKMMVVKAKVRRGGEVARSRWRSWSRATSSMIEAGDLVPADGRIIRAATLEIDESALTGESAPVPKQVEAVAADAALGDRVDMAFMNTQVTRGAGTIVVTSTGMGTEVGHISDMLQAQTAEETPLTKQLNTLTNQILIIAGRRACCISIGLGLWRGQPFDTLFLTAVAFSVSAIPTGLPAVVTTILAAGTSTLAKAGAIVKRLRSVETLGSTSAINSDKTGTLTLNQMTAVQMAVVGHRYTITGEGYSTVGQHQPRAGGERRAARALPAADGAVRRRGREGRRAGGRPDRGRARRARRQGRRRPGAHPRAVPAHRRGAVRRRLQVHGHVPRDDRRRAARTSSAATSRARRTSSWPGPRARPPRRTARPSRSTRSATRTWPRTSVSGAQGLRVMATGYRDFDPATFDPSAADLLPLVAGPDAAGARGHRRPAARRGEGRHRDRPRGRHPGADDHRRPRGDRGGDRAPAGHHRPRDHRRRVRRDGRRGACDREIDDIGVIARVAPEDKVHLVDILKRKGHVVAMTGDGVNDAPALKKADIGVAMGITGTEVSKEAAVMILTDDNFATIVKAVELGRALYDNLIRYIRFQMAVPVRVHRARSSARASCSSPRACRSCRSRRCGSTSRSRCSSPSASATARRARA